MTWELLMNFKMKTKFYYLFSGLSILLLYSNALAKMTVILHYSAYLVKWISASYRKGIDKLIRLSTSCSSLLSLFIKTHLKSGFIILFYTKEILIPNLLSYGYILYLNVWKLRTVTFRRFFRLKSKLISKDTYGRGKEHMVSELVVHHSKDSPIAA